MCFCTQTHSPQADAVPTNTGSFPVWFDPNFISIQKECSSLMNVIKAGGEALGGCQQDDCWVACREGDELRPARAEMQLLHSRLFPGERKRVGAEQYENVGVSTYEVKELLCLEGWGRWVLRARAILMLQKTGNGRRHFGRPVQQVAILKCTVWGIWELIKKNWLCKRLKQTLIDDWLSGHMTAWTLLWRFLLRSATGSLCFRNQHQQTKRFIFLF